MADIHLSESGLFIACLYDRGSLSRLSTVVVVEATKTSLCISSIGSRGRIGCPGHIEPAGAECTIEDHGSKASSDITWSGSFMYWSQFRGGAGIWTSRFCGCGLKGVDSVGGCGLGCLYLYPWNSTSRALTVMVCFLLGMCILYIECEFVYLKNMPFSARCSNLLPGGRRSSGMWTSNLYQKAADG